MKTIISLVLVALSALVFSSNSSGSAVSFVDTIKYWGDGAGWGASQSWDTDIANGSWDGNAIDVIGDPNITGGTAAFNNAGKLMSVTFNYYTPYNDWRMLAPGNLFINVLNSANDTTWDFVVTTMGDPTKGQTDGSNSTLNPGFYNIFNISSWNIDAKRGSNDSAYIVSGADNAGDWSGWYLRNNHPIGIQQTILDGSLKVGQADYSGFPGLTAPINGIFQGSSIYDFSSIGGLDLGDHNNIIVAWEMTCANDVIYEQVNNPAPEPSTFILLGAGLLGAGLARRRFRR